MGMFSVQYVRRGTSSQQEIYSRNVPSQSHRPKHDGQPKAEGDCQFDLSPTSEIIGRPKILASAAGPNADPATQGLDRPLAGASGYLTLSAWSRLRGGRITELQERKTVCQDARQPEPVSCSRNCAEEPSREQQTTPCLTPQRVVRVGKGRIINLVCLGEGSRTVILSAGLGGWSFPR
jgi:hypothetical protein